MRKALVAVFACVILLSVTANSQTRRRSTPSRTTRASVAAAEKASAEIHAGRQRIALQIKTLTQFLYLFGGVVKGFESVDQVARSEPPPPSAIELNERNKTKVKDSIRNLRDGLDKLEAGFRFNPALSRYYPNLSGVARTCETAENLATASRFNEAGRSLLRVVDQLADTLAVMR